MFLLEKQHSSQTEFCFQNLTLFEKMSLLIHQLNKYKNKYPYL